MFIVEAFDRSMIEQFLRKTGWRFLVDSDGDYEVRFHYDDDTGCELTMYLTLEGKNKQIYSIRVMSDKRFPKSQWGQAVMICNMWNKEKRWPKAYFHVRNPEEDTVGSIHLESCYNFEQGVHQELFDDMSATIVSGANLFWEWAHKEQGL